MKIRTLTTKDFRLGNLVTATSSHFGKDKFRGIITGTVDTIVDDKILIADENSEHIIPVSIEYISGVKATEELLVQYGGHQEPTWLKHSSFDISKFEGELKLLTIDLGVGMINIRHGEVNKARHLDDITTIHNTDIDGPIYMHKIQNLYFELSNGKELIKTVVNS